MKIIESIMKNNPCYTAGKKITVKGLMLHSVGCNQPSASAFVKAWNKSSYSSACVHAFIDANTGDVYQTLPWNHRGWHCGGSGNNTHIGVEMCEPSCITYTGGASFTCSDKTTAKKCAERTYNSAVELFAMLCDQFKLDPMKDILSHKEGHSKGIASGHSDPEHLWKGLGLSYTMDGFRKAVKAKMTVTDAPKGLQAKDLADLTPEDLIKKVGSLFTADQKKTGVLASVSFAQFILESGWGKSELAVNANNCFGMKSTLSGNSWSGSTWDGKSVYKKETGEWNGSSYTTVTADFRKYPCVEDSIADHSAYLLGAKKGSDLRYAGLKGCTDYKKAITIIKDGGYATAPTYVGKICSLIERYDLTKYDYKTTTTTKGKVKQINVYYPSYKRKTSPDDRKGAGCVWRDQDNHVLVIDNYVRNSEPANKVIKYLLDKGLTTIDFVGTHGHYDHISGGFQILNDARFTVQNVYVYDPESLKLAGTGSANAKSAKEDKEYLKEFIKLAKSKGAKVHIVDDGDQITCGDMVFDVYRRQPTSFTSLDQGNAYAYVNNGSLCLYSKQAYFMMSGDACSADFVKEHNLKVKGCEVGHHGNNGSQSKAKIFIDHGCVFAIQCNNEKGTAGSCEFTRYGSGRMKEAGVTPWQLNGNIFGFIKNGQVVFKQGSKNKVSWSCPFGTAEDTGVTTVVTEPKTQKQKVPFLIRVKKTLNIYKGAGTNYVSGKKCPVGIYTIVEVSADGDWGRLKSGAGWIYIANADHTEKV